MNDATQKRLKAGVMGFPIAHSRSPRLHAYWLDQYKIEGSYEAFAVKPSDLAREIGSLQEKGLQGVNLTVPHKEAVLALLDFLDPLARAVGAVNLVVQREDGRREGHNTDVYGFTQNLLSHQVDVNNRICVVLGAGGAARAVVAGLQQMHAGSIRIINRTVAHAERLRDSFGGAIEVFSFAEAEKAVAGSGLLVNTTSLGMEGCPPLTFPLSALPRDAVVTDLVYTPLMTDLLVAANERGHPIVTGLGMLLHQARPAFKAFFGRDPMVTDELVAYMTKGLNA